MSRDRRMREGSSIGGAERGANGRRCADTRGGGSGGDHRRCSAPSDSTRIWLPVWKIRRRPQLATVGINDRAANRQSHSHALWLGGEERFKELIRPRRVEPGARVLAALSLFRTNRPPSRREGRSRAGRSLLQRTRVEGTLPPGLGSRHAPQPRRPSRPVLHAEACRSRPEVAQ
jgi:hypothetical protein